MGANIVLKSDMLEKHPPNFLNPAKKWVLKKPAPHFSNSRHCFFKPRSYNNPPLQIATFSNSCVCFFDIIEEIDLNKLS